MERRREVAKSLEEIASLLLHLHNHYFSKVLLFNLFTPWSYADNKVLFIHVQTSSDQLLSEILLLRDARILSPELTVLDAVEIYATTSPPSKASSPLSYEDFYSWLRSIASTLYPQAASPSRAFHQLLIEVNIIRM
jgi:hypothetical protein